MKEKKCTCGDTESQLIERVAELRHQNEQYLLKDQLLRKEFAKAFEWYKTQRSYGSEPEVQLPSWEQVFVNVGFLTAQRDFRSYEGNISELECKLDDLEKKIRTEIHPNL